MSFVPQQMGIAIYFKPYALITKIIFQNVNLARNKIRSLDGLQDHDFLEAINIEDNEVNKLHGFSDGKSLYARLSSEINSLQGSQVR